MIQILKDIIKLWITIILIIILTCTVVITSILFLTCIGMGPWQVIIICTLWFTFWLSFMYVVNMREINE